MTQAITYNMYHYGDSHCKARITSQLSHLYNANPYTLTHWGRDKMAAIFQCIFLNENAWFPIEISLKFVCKGLINNIPALVQIMAWSRPGDKPLSEPMVVILLTHICVTRPQWINSLWSSDATWRHGSGSTLAQVMACCLMPPSHYLNQCWLTHQ